MYETILQTHRQLCWLFHMRLSSFPAWVKNLWGNCSLQNLLQLRVIKNLQRFMQVLSPLHYLPPRPANLQTQLQWITQRTDTPIWDHLKSIPVLYLGSHENHVQWRRLPPACEHECTVVGSPLIPLLFLKMKAANSLLLLALA